MTITLQTKTGEFILDSASSNEPILFRGLADGLTLPYECATGTCGTCRARVMSGDVEVAWPQAPGAARLKPDKGDVLMCQAHARGVCTLRIPADVARLDGGVAQLPTRFGGRIAGMARLTPDVIHFDVGLGDNVRFEAGQFMVVSAPGPTGGRAYSMVNYAPETNQMSFVVKRKPAGAFSDWLFDTAEPGAEISLFGPLGKATFRPETDGDLICITGGSGIAGIMSILDHASASGHFKRAKGQLYFGVRTLADIFYLDELASMVAKSNGALQVRIVLSHETPSAPTHPERAEIQLDQGFVHEVAARELGAQKGTFSDTAIGFVAGPPPMVDGAIRVLLSEAGLPPNRIRYDKFN